MAALLHEAFQPFTAFLGAGLYGTRGEVKQKRFVTGRIIHKRQPLKDADVRLARSRLVGQLMRERGVSLPDASKIIKAEGLAWT